ncbi:hypothetical protein QM180_17810 [Acinetobacter nosocomialis]|nr:hypothetical protein [Acinetobacter nosocomialis]MCF1273255.1 hypothetical protein [Acinetobacter nosocomialis]MDV5588978.1 hypothetical protein [Acinetobacter nosocomialis]
MAYSTQDHIAIQANTLNNQSLNGLAPVIASRGDLDLGVQVLNNLENNLNHQSGSQIIAMGDLRIGGSLDSQWHALLRSMRLIIKLIENILDFFIIENRWLNKFLNSDGMESLLK